MPFVERLVSMTTPNRVLALCQLVAYKSLTKQQLIDLIQPENLNSSKDQFTNVFSFAKNGNLIEEDSASGKIKLKVKESDIATPKAFRSTVSKLGLTNPNLMFYRFTSWYLIRGEKVFAENNKALAMAFNSEMQFEDDSPNKYNDTNVNGWKSWACFLGYGFEHGGVVIPNTVERLSDILSDNREITRGRFIPFAEFMSILSPELDGGEVFNRNKGETTLPSQHLSLGLSSGLRALHDQGIIQLHYQSDALDTWFLTKCSTHEIIREVSEIKIGR